MNTEKIKQAIARVNGYKIHYMKLMERKYPGGLYDPMRERFAESCYLAMCTAETALKRELPNPPTKDRIMYRCAICKSFCGPLRNMDDEELSPFVYCPECGQRLRE